MLVGVQASRNGAARSVPEGTKLHIGSLQLDRSVLGVWPFRAAFSELGFFMGVVLV